MLHRSDAKPGDDERKPPSFYQGDWEPDSDPCPACNQVGGVKSRVWHNGSVEQVHYVCETCRYDWWFDGADC